MALVAGLIVYLAFLSVSGFSLVVPQAVCILKGPAEILFLMGFDTKREKLGQIVCLPALPGMTGFTGQRQLAGVDGGFWISFGQNAVAGVAVVALGATAGLRTMTVFLVRAWPAPDSAGSRSGLVAFVPDPVMAVPATQIFPVGGVLEFGYGNGAGAGPPGPWHPRHSSVV
jgi:hypothetical protein